MTMISSNAYTSEIIGNIKFKIPLYQRPYAWEDFQVLQLLKDLLEQFHLDCNEKYYIGILNVGATEEEEVYDLIDGQQRITTLNLIGSVLKAYYSQWNDFLENRLNLYGRTEDQLFLKNHESSTKTNSKMKNAVDVIGEFINKEVSIDKKLFSKYVYEKASFFISKVPDHYSLMDKNLQFVRMNNRGKQLEAHDVLKIKLATFIDDEFKRNQFINNWNKCSQLGCSDFTVNNDKPKKIIHLLTSEESNYKKEKQEEIFYQSIVTFPEFLLIALSRYFQLKNIDVTVSHIKGKHSDDIRKDKLLEEFGFGEKQIDFIWTEEFVLDFEILLKKQNDLFDKYIIKRDKEENYKFTGDKERFIGNSLLELTVFQSFLFVTREPLQSNWLIDTFDYLEEKNTEKIETLIFLNFLKKLDNDRCNDRNIGNLDYTTIDRYWFWRLDYYLWENRRTRFSDRALNIAEKYVFRINRSIEHIGPQTPQSNSSVDINSILLHSFGNLAMISSGQNSSLQNESFEIKRAHVDAFINGSKGGTIESLKMLSLYQYNTWNDENVKNHNTTMIDVLINSFNNDYLNIINSLKLL